MLTPLHLCRELAQRARDVVGAWAALVRGELFPPAPPAYVPPKLELVELKCSYCGVAVEVRPSGVAECVDVDACDERFAEFPCSGCEQPFYDCTCRPPLAPPSRRDNS